MVPLHCTTNRVLCVASTRRKIKKDLLPKPLDTIVNLWYTHRMKINHTTARSLSVATTVFATVYRESIAAMDGDEAAYAAAYEAAYDAAFIESQTPLASYQDAGAASAAVSAIAQEAADAFFGR